MSRQDIWAATITGNLVRDPEEKHLDSGHSLAKFTVAVNRKNESVTYVDVQVWGERRGPILQYLEKGRHVTVVGRMSVNEYQTQKGEQRSQLVLDADSVDFGERPKEQPMESPVEARPTESEPDQPDKGFYGKDGDELPF